MCHTRGFVIIHNALAAVESSPKSSGQKANWSTPPVQETTAEIREQWRVGSHSELSLARSTSSQKGWDVGHSPSQCCRHLFLGLLAGQLVDLGGSVHVGDSGGELEFFPIVDPQIT